MVFPWQSLERHPLDRSFSIDVSLQIRLHYLLIKRASRCSVSPGHPLTFTRLSYVVIHFIVFLRMSDDSRKKVFSRVRFVIHNIICSSDGLFRIVLLCFDLLKCRLFVANVTQLWIFKSARLECVYVFGCRVRLVNVCVWNLEFTPFAHCDLALRRMMFVLGCCFLVFGGVLTFTYTGICVYR